MPVHAILVTLLTVLLIAAAMQVVGSARGKYQVRAPATSGPIEFERAFRAHQNTLEATVMFLPVLWIAALWCSDWWAGIAGYAWLLGRAWYLYGYAFREGRRAGGFYLAITANLVLLGMGFCALWPALRG